MEKSNYYEQRHSDVFHEGGIGERKILSYFVHLERIEGLRIVRFHFVLWIDELLVRFKYSGFSFEIEMDWGGDLRLRTQQEVPKEIFDFILIHMKNFKSVSWKELRAADKRYRKIAQGL